MSLSTRQAECTMLMIRLMAWAYLQPLLASGAMYIKVTWVKRSLTKQKELVRLGRSKTLGSAHLEELAWDIQLYWKSGTPVYAVKY